MKLLLSQLATAVMLSPWVAFAEESECAVREQAQLSYSMLQNGFGDKVMSGNDTALFASHTSKHCQTISVGSERLAKFGNVEYGANLRFETKVAPSLAGSFEFWHTISGEKILPRTAGTISIFVTPSDKIEWFSALALRNYADSQSLIIAPGANVATSAHVWVGATAYAGGIRFPEPNSHALSSSVVLRSKYQWDSGTFIEGFCAKGLEPNYDSISDSQKTATHYSYGLRPRIYIKENIFVELSASNDVVRSTYANENRMTATLGGWW